MHHHRRRPPFGGGERVRRDLPLAEHPLLDLESDFAFVSVSPTTETPYVELVGDTPLPELFVEASGGTTRVRTSGMAQGLEHLSRGRFWEGSFWDRRRLQKHFHVQLVVHVPADVRAQIRPSAAYIHVERLTGCQLDIHADAGAIVLEHVSGHLVLGTDAGRIDGTGLAGSISASTSAGAIRIEIADLDPGRHKIRTSMGAAIVEVARGLPVQIDTRTAMGSSRVDAVSTRGASAVLDVEAELGAIRVLTSRREWVATRSAVNTGSPYRSANAPSAPADDEAMEKILARVADGTLSPQDARELLRSMGWA
jgi:hypothetical protein